ncbi:MAG: hypothetical protein LBU38_02405 [Propionibacteriaceae bacterium]|jgi:hypothetical protein|nr:hypothetical protein [Propionibacteriaceae bacterium]
MLKKTIPRSKYLLAELLGTVIYGVVIYFVFTWLAGYSLLYAYFGNLALIVLLIASEEYLLRALESEAIFKRLSERETEEAAYRSLQKSIENNISFKTILYLFYVFILIFSKILETNPGLVGEDLSSFILSNNYSILLLIALDRLIGQFSNERERMNKLSAKLEKYFTENQG